MSEEKKRIEAEDKALREIFAPDVIAALELTLEIRQKRAELAKLIAPRGA